MFVPLSTRWTTLLVAAERCYVSTSRYGAIAMLQYCWLTWLALCSFWLNDLNSKAEGSEWEFTIAEGLALMGSHTLMDNQVS